MTEEYRCRGPLFPVVSLGASAGGQLRKRGQNRDRGPGTNLCGKGPEMLSTR